MEHQEEVLESLIEDVAALLATGYLRLRKARSRSEAAVPPAHLATDDRLDNAPRTHGVVSLAPHEKGD
jgi:hypothetical protein